MSHSRTLISQEIRGLTPGFYRPAISTTHALASATPHLPAPESHPNTKVQRFPRFTYPRAGTGRWGKLSQSVSYFLISQRVLYAKQKVRRQKGETISQKEAGPGNTGVVYSVLSLPGQSQAQPARGEVPRVRACAAVSDDAAQPLPRVRSVSRLRFSRAISSSSLWYSRYRLRFLTVILSASSYLALAIARSSSVRAISYAMSISTS
jgi:hypothetical protein